MFERRCGVGRLELLQIIRIPAEMRRRIRLLSRQTHLDNGNGWRDCGAPSSARSNDVDTQLRLVQLIVNPKISWMDCNNEGPWKLWSIFGLKPDCLVLSRLSVQ